VGAWLKCIATNYGTAALKDQNSVSGFKLKTPVKVDPLTKVVQDQIANTPQSVLWFEALFGSKATTTSQTNAAQLVTGKVSPDAFMKLVQTDAESAQ
jgi:raffinose/stachyose/melibiose transport system substrate-binding protein